jgi:hypothetical protein
MSRREAEAGRTARSDRSNNPSSVDQGSGTSASCGVSRMIGLDTVRILCEDTLSEGTMTYVLTWMQMHL